jgi:hypothetical protein
MGAITKWSFLLFSSVFFVATINAQYPATGNKQRLGWQTTGDGLVYRGAIADTATINPGGLNNAWMLLDTVNGNLYAYREHWWQLVSGGGGLSMPFNSVTFNVNETDASEQELQYSADKGYLQYGGLDSVQIPLLPGIWYVRNDTSVTIPKGTVVRATGTLGASGRIKVKHMIANGTIPAMYVLGIAMQDIAVGADGYVMTQGKIRKVNTTAYSEGAVLYADVDTLGGLTQTEPGNGYLKLPIAFVVHSASNGTLAVRVNPGSSLYDLHDVDTDGRVDGSVLRYDSALKYWKASTTAGIVAGDTAAMLTNYINIADTATMLSSYISNADTSVFARDFQISGTSGQVTYFNGSNTVTGDANLTWSAANRTLGINTTTTSGANIIIKNTQEPIRDAAWLPQQTFGADTTNWTRGTGWTFNGTQAVATAATGALTYTTLPDTIISGRAYEVTYTLASYSAGFMVVGLGNATLTLPRYNVTGNTILLQPTSATGGFRFTTSTFTGNIDNVSVVEVRNPAPVILAGQNDSDATLYSPIRMPNSVSMAIAGGGRFTTGLNNYFFGTNAGLLNTSGANNNFFGTSAGSSNVSGFSNNFFGNNAGSFNTSGFSNNFFGVTSGFFNTVGSNNNFFGNQSGYNNTSGFSNNFFGENAGFGNTTGLYNNAFGNNAGRSATTANYNNFFGYQTGRSVTTGNRNNFMGDDTGYNTTLADTLTGSSNTLIGAQSARNIASSASGNLVLGNSVNLPTGNGSNQVVIKNLIFGTGASGTGTTIQTTAKAGINVNSPQSTLDVEGNMAIGATYSGTTAAPTNGLIVEGNTGIGTSSPQRRLHITGTVRVDTLTRDVPTRIVGADADGDLAALTLGTGLSIASGTLNGPSVSGTTNYLPKFTGANTIGNSVAFESSGRIGIGTTSVDSKLTVVGTDSSGFIPRISARFSDASQSSLYIAHPTGTSSTAMLIGNGQLGLATSPGAASGYTERVRIASDGKVGIGTTSPARTLHVEGEARISDLTTDTPTRIVGADADGDLGAITLGTGLSISSGTLNASGITSVYIPINLFSPGDTVTNTTNAKNFFLVHSGLNGYCIDSYTVKAIAGTGTADIQVDKNDTGGNLQAISGTTVYTKDTNIALVTGDYIRGQVFNISGTLIGLGLTLEIKATCN